jgi:RHS repeat-associated protein
MTPTCFALSLKCIRLVSVVLAMMIAGLARADVITYYHNDLLGSPRVATNASGQMVWSESYTPHGQRLNGQVVSNKIWYTSRHQDDDTGLIYMGARYYDPVTGRFIGVDAIRFHEANIHSFNRYAYASNNPYRYRDPNGMWVEDVAIAVPSLIMGAVSMRENVNKGSYGAATVDGAGMLADAILAAIPGIPGGVGFAIAATRKLEIAATEAAAADVAKLGKKLASEEGVAELMAGGGKSIAGAGTGKELRDAGRLASEYGGNPSDWAKVTSTAKDHMQTHAYRNLETGQTVEFKSIP